MPEIPTSSPSDCTVQRKRQQILQLHRKLHSDNKLGLMQEGQVEPPSLKFPRDSILLGSSDIKRLLGEPLPLPYFIESRDSSAHRQSPHTGQHLRQLPTVKSDSYSSSRRETSNSSQTSASTDDRLQSSIQNMLNSHSKDQPIFAQQCDSDLHTVTPNADVHDTSTQNHKATTQLDRNFFTPSPPAFSRLIADSSEMAEVIKDFRNQYMGLNQNGPAESTRRVRTTARNSSITTIMFLALISVACGLLYGRETRRQLDQKGHF